MRFGEESIRYRVDDAREGLAADSPVAPVVFLTCESGRFDGERRCLAEEMLFTKGGPPAAIGATTESHPLPNLFTGRALLARLSTGSPRLGEVWVDAQRRAAKMRDFVMEKMLKDVEGSLEPEIDVAKLMRDQPLMYAILGDPALRLKLPAPLDVEVEITTDGRRYTVTKPEGATGLTVGRRARPKRGRREFRAGPANAEEAAKVLAAANAKESFNTVATMSRDEEWSGMLTEPGTWRFVAVTADGLHAAVVEVR
jgi:hypothetical protein